MGISIAKGQEEKRMSDIEVGLKGIKEMVVERQDLASVMGNVGAEVLSTHRVVLLMELAARKTIEDRLPEGMMTVGTFIRIQHLAAAPLGSKVRAEARLKRIEGRRLVFDVAVFDETEKLAEGENEQLIVSVDKFLSRIKKKRLR
jgi:predicted thioesterase